jgi:hypothetical protein
MNVFEIFCEGDGRINEANMSSALHFLLNPKAPHGFGVTSLREFLSPISDQLEMLCQQRHVLNPYRTFELASFLRSFDHIDFSLEEKVFNPSPEVGQRNHRDIDIVIKFFRDFDTTKAPSFVVAIENKIIENSASEDQITDEYKFLRARLNSDYALTQTELQIPIVFIYLTPAALGRKTNEYWTQLVLPTQSSETESDFKAHYSWKTIAADNPASIVSLVTNLINKEQYGSINPASSYSSLFLRSMLNFINNDFKTESRKYQEELAKAPVIQVHDLMSSADFWQLWENGKSRSLSYAQQLYEKISSKFLNCLNSTPKFTKTRVSFYSETIKNGAILFAGRTTNGIVEVQIKRNDGHVITAELQNRCEALGIEINDDFNSFNLCVPITVPLKDSGILICELIQKLCECETCRHLG